MSAVVQSRAQMRVRHFLAAVKAGVDGKTAAKIAHRALSADQFSVGLRLMSYGVESKAAFALVDDHKLARSLAEGIEQLDSDEAAGVRVCHPDSSTDDQVSQAQIIVGAMMHGASWDEARAISRMRSRDEADKRTIAILVAFGVDLSAVNSIIQEPGLCAAMLAEIAHRSPESMIHFDDVTRETER